MDLEDRTSRKFESRMGLLLRNGVFGTTFILIILLKMIFFASGIIAVVEPVYVLILSVSDALILIIYAASVFRVRTHQTYGHIEMESLTHKNEELEKENRRLKGELKKHIKMAYQDTTTSLPNRRYGMKLLNSAIEIASINQNNNIAVLILDIDNFKYVNDTLGHPIGDLLLVKVSERIKCSVESYGTVFRLGGDEFMILVDKECTECRTKKLSEDIIEVFSEPFQLEEAEVHVSASIGVAIYPVHGANVDELIKHADIAMYKAKQSGRNTYRLFDNSYIEEINGFIFKPH